MLRKIASVFTILVFVLSGPQTSLAQTAGKPEGLSSANVETQVPPIHKKILEPARPAMLPEKNPYFITVPETSGSIEEVFQGSSDQPLVVHIQNVHANYEAQVNIKNILNHLARNFGFSLIQLEGAVSRLDPDILKPSYLEEANLKLADFLMREGRITGADAFAVETNLPVELYGIEDPALYMENLRMFRSIYAHREAVDGFFKNIYELIDRVGRAMLTPGQLDFTRKKDVFARDRIDLLDYLMFLNQVSESLSLTSLKDLKNMAEYPNLVRIMRLHDLEASLDQAKLKKEGEDLKAAFLKALPDSGLPAELLSKLEEKEKGLRPRDYFLKLTDLAEEAGISFAGFPQIRAYAEYSIYQDEIDHRALFPELKNFESYLEAALFKTEDEKTLLAAISRANLLEQYFKLEMSREKLALYVRDSVELKPTLVASALKGLAEKYSVNFPLDVDAASLDAHMKDLEYYYRLVLKRDEVFFGNIMSRLRESGKDKTILVTGGFHKEGLVEQYRRENISYVIVSPNVDVAAGNENYVKVMMGEDAVVGSVFAGSFAVEIRSALDKVLHDRAFQYALAAGSGSAVLWTLAEEGVNDQNVSRLSTSLQTAGKASGVEVKIVDVRIAGNLVIADVTVKLPLVNGGREFVAEAQLDRKTGNFKFRPKGEIKGPPKETIEPQEVGNIPSLRDLFRVLVEEAKGSSVIVNEISPGVFLLETPLGIYIFDEKEIPNEELLLKLFGMTSAQIGSVRAEVRKRNAPITVETLEKVIEASSGTVAAVSIEALGFSEEQLKAYRLMAELLATPLTQPGLVVLALDVHDPEAESAIREIYESVKGDNRLAYVVYGAGIGGRFGEMRGQIKDLSEEAQGRVLIIEGTREDAFVNFDEAAAELTEDLQIRKGSRWFNHLRGVEGSSALKQNDVIGRTSAIIPSGEVGERMLDTISKNFSQLNSLRNLGVSEIPRDAELRKALRAFEMKSAKLLTNISAEELKRQLQDLLELIRAHMLQIQKNTSAFETIRNLIRFIETTKQIATAA